MALSKWKNIFPIGRNENVRGKSKSVDKPDIAEVGFKMILDPIGTNSATSSIAENNKQPKVSVPELNVHIIGARHLPSLFGLKTVEGYMIKVKLFPGTKRYDTSVQTNASPKFNETFKFPMAPALKSSIRSKSKDEMLARSLPEKLFKGHFVVLTVFALLELPPGALNPIKETYQSFKRKGSILLKEKKIIKGSETSKTSEDKKDNKDEIEEKSVLNLTKSESRRNIGSVTCFLDPKIFMENTKTGHHCTEEFWFPVKDITLSTNKSKNYTPTTSPKGQVEVSLQICNQESINEPSTPCDATKSINPFDTNGVDTSRHNDIVALNSNQEDHDKNSNDDGHSIENGASGTTAQGKSRWSFGDMKKKIKGSHKKDKHNQIGTCLKISITRMRCSIKVKEEFENIAGEEVYLKMTVLERGILSATWKSKKFSPTLSMRWDPIESSIYIPLVNDYDMEYISIKISIATKTKVGKKIHLGTVQLGQESSVEAQEQWDEMINTRGSTISKWHSFE